MKKPEILAIVKNGLYSSAIKHITKELKIPELLKFSENFRGYINEGFTINYLILDAHTIPEPIKFSLEKFVAKNPNTPILILNSEHIDQSAEPYVHTLIQSSDSDAIVLLKFQTYFSKLLENEIEDYSDNTISEREKEVLQLVAQGKTNKEISDQLHISPHTVIAHRKNITSKLGIKTIAGLAVYAVLNGLIDPEEMNK